MTRTPCHPGIYSRDPAGHKLPAAGACGSLDTGDKPRYDNQCSGNAVPAHQPAPLLAQVFVEPTNRGRAGADRRRRPHGCGKSNLLEALRWVMGENCTRACAPPPWTTSFLRHGDRPRATPRKYDLIDNSARQAPTEFNGSTDGVTRRIEREAGSATASTARGARARRAHPVRGRGDGSPLAALGARARSRAGQVQARQRRRILKTPRHRRPAQPRPRGGVRLRAAEGILPPQRHLGQLNSQIESLKRRARAARRTGGLGRDRSSRHRLLLAWAEAQGQVDVGEPISPRAGEAGAPPRPRQGDQRRGRRRRPAATAARSGSGQGRYPLRFKIEQENLEREAQRTPTGRRSSRPASSSSTATRRASSR